MMEAARPVMLIAGGTGSIGRAVAHEAVAAGWRVALHGRGATAAGENGVAIVRDMREPGAATAVVAETHHLFGRIDAVVDCVSMGAPGTIGPFASTDPAAFAAMLDVSLGHLQRLAHAALPALREAGGTLIAFASDAGRFVAADQSIVAASRAGIMAFVRNLAVEEARNGMRAHCISPGFVDGSASFERALARTPERIARARARAGLGLPTPADIAPLAVFLCGPGARRITGQVISINGGLNA